MSACAVKPSSDMDSPAYHHKAGMRNLDMGEYQSAANSFLEQLDKKLRCLMRVWASLTPT